MIILSIYIVSCIISYGMATASWYSYYEEMIIKWGYDLYNNNIGITITPDVWLYTILGPGGIMICILNKCTTHPTKYLVKWSFRGLRRYKGQKGKYDHHSQLDALILDNCKN